MNFPTQNTHYYAHNSFSECKNTIEIDFINRANTLQIWTSYEQDVNNTNVNMFMFVSREQTFALYWKHVWLFVQVPWTIAN